MLAGLAALIGNKSGFAQSMMQHVDLSSPRMREAELTRADIEGAIAKGGPLDLKDKALNGLDLSGLSLQNADLRWARLNRTRLANADLRGARLELAWAIEADLTRADLRRANLFQGQFARSLMNEADLSEARVAANLEGTSLRGAHLAQADGAADMRNQSMGLMRTVLRRANADGADFSGARLARADLEYARLRGANLENVDLARSLMGGADLTGARVAGLTLSGADLAGALLLELEGEEGINGLEESRNLDRTFRD